MNWNRYSLRRIMWMLVGLVFITFLIFHLRDLSQWFSKLLALLTPFLVGGGMAFILNAPLRMLEQRVFVHIKNKRFKKFQRGIGIFLSLVLIGCILSVIGRIIIPQLVDSVSLFAGNIPNYIESLERFLDQMVKQFPDAEKQIDSIRASIASLSPELVQEKITNFVWGGADNGVSRGDNSRLITNAVFSTFGFVSSLFGYLLNGLIAFVFSIYVLASKENLAIQGRRIIFAFFNRDMAKYVIHVFQVAFAKFYSFLTGQMLEATILGVLMFIGLFILRVPYALMIGVLVGFSALIPIAGALIGGVVGFLLVMSVSFSKAIIFLVFLILLQQFETNVIYPKVVGGSVGLPSMWTLLAITFGGSLMGLVGMLIFVPIVGTIYTLFAEIVYGRLQMKNIPLGDPNVLYGVPDDKRLPH